MSARPGDIFTALARASSHAGHKNTYRVACSEAGLLISSRHFYNVLKEQKTDVGVFSVFFFCYSKKLGLVLILLAFLFIRLQHPRC